MLDKQIQIFSVDTGNFYSNKESHLHWLNHKLKIEKNELLCKLKKIKAESEDSNCFEQERLEELISMKSKKIKEVKDSLLLLLSNKIEANIQSNGKHHIRALSENKVSDKNVISVFDSYFTRTIGAKPDELCDDFMVIQVYYFDVIKDLIYFGFTYKGEKYVYFTSSAGQIRTKKCVFVKESVWKKYEKTIMCGLTLDDINAKGGNNSNKHLAYLALANSATDIWEEFDIDKTIVIDDFETEVFGTYDLVDDVDYSIKRMSGHVPITHTDGAGMMLPCMGKNRMVRLPWVKGLLGVFDFKKFIEVNGCSPIIKDIYGKEHDVIAEDIQIIFTKSQFKMHKYYSSWDDYKEKYKKYGCAVGITNVEEDRIKDATINYQMLQTLTDITDEEVIEIASRSAKKLENLWSSGKDIKTAKDKIRAIENIKAVFGSTPYNTNKTAFQKSIDLYPDLMNDEYVKSQLRDIKKAMRKKYRAGKLSVCGKYTFILPDFYAACEHWFMGVSDSVGLLGSDEVYCKLFAKYEKLDCLRSPHLYMEHAVRKNGACHNIDAPRRNWLSEWYCTDAVYTSCRDLISKVLQFDVDGDKALVVADKTLIKVAERNLEKFDIVPLYYNMKKAEPVYLDNESIYNGLNAAFTGGNIGIYSNNISKIWNSDVFLSGTDEEKKQAIDVIKLLCMENNFVIDYAKTLYKPKRPKKIKKLIAEYTNVPLPHFFKYAKDKTDDQVASINDSFVNKLDMKIGDEYVIPNKNINLRNIGLGDIDYKLLMNNPDIECMVTFADNGRIIKEETDPLIVAYCKLDKQHRFTLDNATRIDKAFSVDMVRKSQLRHNLKYKNAINETKNDLMQYGYNDVEIADMLIKFLYGIKNSKHKTTLWFCYGDIIFSNLEKNIKPQTKSVQCVDCGEWFEVGIKDNETCRCPSCYAEYRKKYKAQKEKERRERLRGQRKINN